MFGYAEQVVAPHNPLNFCLRKVRLRREWDEAVRAVEASVLTFSRRPMTASKENVDSMREEIERLQLLADHALARLNEHIKEHDC